MRILTTKQTCDKIGKGRTKLWELVKAGRFPKPIKIDNGVGYVEHEVDGWISDRIAERDQGAVV